MTGSRWGSVILRCLQVQTGLEKSYQWQMKKSPATLTAARAIIPKYQPTPNSYVR